MNSIATAPGPFDLNPTVRVGPREKLVLLAGPCQIESAEHCLMIAGTLQEICKKFPISLVFKASFDKANRTSLAGQRGPGMEQGLSMLAAVKKSTGLPIITDVHTADQAAPTALVADILQIPAFLCRQTDLLLAVGATGRAVNCKKGQFMHPADMRFSAEKIASTGNHRIMLCERGSSFGYRDLVVDPRSLIMLGQSGYPVIFDATHSVQSMGGEKGQSGGSRQFIPALVRSAVAIGVSGLFIECHDAPERAPSDGQSMLPLSELAHVLEAACEIRASALRFV